MGSDSSLPVGGGRNITQCIWPHSRDMLHGFTQHPHHTPNGYILSSFHLLAPVILWN